MSLGTPTELIMKYKKEITSMFKRIVVPAVTALISFALLVIAGHRTTVRADSGCGPSSIANTYGFAVSGLVNFSPSGQPQPIGDFIPLAAAGTFSFDGRSNVSRSFTVSIGGVVFPVTDPGTYTMSSNCTGSAVFADAGETWDLVVVSGGKEIKTTIATPGRVLAGTLTRQTAE
jgi:hypothetical protein